VGTTPIEIKVDDGKGGIATQKFELVVAEASSDREAPIVRIGSNGTVLKAGDTLDLKVQGFQYGTVKP
jgi:hypothetical protein